MKTNNPPIAAWAPGAALAKLASRRNNAPCVLTDGPAEFNDVALIRLSDYEALQAAYEEELFQVRQTRDTHFGELMRAIEQVDTLKAECEKLRKDAERIEWLGEQTKKSYTGISFDYHRYVEDGYVVDHGYRFMRRHFASGFKDSLRKAIDAAMQETSHDQ